MPTRRSSTRPFPVRQVSRLATELHLTGIDNLRVLSPGKYERGVLLIGLARHGLPDWFAGNRLRRPKEPTCFTSINALAGSFGRSFETVRRHVRALVTEGTVVEGEQGIAISAEPEVARRLIAYLRLTHDTLLSLAQDMAGLGLLPRCPVPATRPITRAIMATALDVQLMPFEGLREPLPDWTLMLVWGVIGALCVRRVTIDPMLSDLYAHASTPDEERDAVTLRTIAAISGVPFSSAWRHVKALEAAGAIRARGDGYIVPTDYLTAPGMEERVAGSAAYYQRRLAELVRQGFNPSGPVPYQNGRPALVSS